MIIGKTKPQTKIYIDNKEIKVSSIMIRATPIMEILTGIMIAGFIFYSGILIAAGELEINNFFSFNSIGTTH